MTESKPRGGRASSEKRSRSKALSEDEERFRRTKEIWTAITAKSLELRDAEREFHGFQGELRRIGAGIKDQYEASRAIRHVRDLGAHREELLRIFLQESGLLPFRYGVSSTSSRVAGSSGYVSKEIDILLYERSANIILRKFGKTLEIYPAETTLGIIQVKSRLTYEEIDSAFDNIASFKRLYAFRESADTNRDGRRGFGIVFAYTSSLSHSQIADRIEQNATKYDTKDLPNTIIVLDGGAFRFGDKDGGYLLNNMVDNINELQVWGDSNVSGDTFYRFYAELIGLLESRQPQQVDLSRYFDLPLMSGEISYRFRLGTSAETAKCPSHGDYLRRLSEDTASRIWQHVRDAEPVNWIRAIDIARGEAGDNYEAYEKQPGKVRIYNPESHPLSDLLVGKNGRLIFDDLEMNGLSVWVPWLYDAKEGLFSECPVCERAKRRRKSRKGKTRGKPPNVA